MCVCVCTCVWVWVGSQEVDTRVPVCINTSYESTANVSMCIDSLVAVHYDATSHGTLGCHKPLHATMLQAAQCYCGSWCGLWLTVLPPQTQLRSINRHQSQDYQQPVVSADIHTTRNPSCLHLPPRSGFDEAPRMGVLLPQNPYHASLSIRAADTLEQ